MVLCDSDNRMKRHEVERGECFQWRLMSFTLNCDRVNTDTHMSSPLLPLRRVSSVLMTEEIFTSLFLFVPVTEAKVKKKGCHRGDTVQNLSLSSYLTICISFFLQWLSDDHRNITQRWYRRFSLWRVALTKSSIMVFFEKGNTRGKIKKKKKKKIS